MLKNRIAGIRTEKGLSQEKLAENSEISRVALSAIENGTIPNGNTMINISKALNKKVEEIFKMILWYIINNIFW